MADPQALRTTIDDLLYRIDMIPRIDAARSDLCDQHALHRQAARDLAAYLTTTYGARIADKAWTNTIRMHGISSSGTSGLVQAFRNWIAAAERRIGLIDA
jgi:hypothetical protein